MDETIAVHQELLKHVPNHEQAWFHLGEVFKEQGKLEESIAAFQRQVEVNPNFAEAWSGLGSAFWRQEKHAAAADAFARGLEVQPKHLILLTNDAELALIQGDKDQTFAIFLPFLVWLDDPIQGWDSVMTAIKKSEPGVTFEGWDFSTTEPAIARLDASTQQTAQHFIAFFTGQIDLPTLEERLKGK